MKRGKAGQGQRGTCASGSLHWLEWERGGQLELGEDWEARQDGSMGGRPVPWSGN